jgi:UDP-N-acetylglucosamine 2-epimerase
LVVGNSSSGLIEAPSFKIPTINIGDRQRGRLKSKTVIDCDPTQSSILNAFKISESESFKLGLRNAQNPFGSGDSSGKIISILRDINLDRILKKNFYNLPII